MRHPHGARATAAILLALVGLLVSGCGPQAAVEPDVVQIDPSHSLGPIVTELDTQIIYPDVLGHVPSGTALLARYAVPRIRLILGTDGAYLPDHPPTLPAGWTRGAWDFRTTDELVTATYEAGARPLVDIGYMPDWMWDCASGRPLDPTYATFGDYAARLVSYYNRGSFIAEDGRVIRNPAGTAHRVDAWEIWNEPDLWTLACVGPSGKGAGLPALTPTTYLAMWNAVAPRMRAIDPTILLAGPTIARGVEGKSDAFLDMLMRSGAPLPDIATMHAYGSHDERDLDRCLFDGYASGTGCLADGLAGMTKTVARLQALAPGRPIWITEANSLASYGLDPKARNWGPLGTAWKASAFARMSALGVGAIFEYSYVHPGGAQFSAVDPVTGDALLSYWTHVELTRRFPVGATMLASRIGRGGVDVLAARLPSGTINVLVVDREVAGRADAGGTGAALALDVRIGDAPGGLTLRMLDAETPLATGPATTTLADGSHVAVAFAGYGAAIITYEPRQAGASHR